jgi:hypothetical protein
MNEQRGATAFRQLFNAAESPTAAPFELRRLLPDEAGAAAPEFAGLIDLWRERRGAAAVPDWSSVEFADFRGWHSALMLSELSEADPDPRFRLIGEDYRMIRDSSLPGQRFSELMPRLFALQFREHFRQIARLGHMGLATGPAAFVGREYLRLRILELPFRHGGEAVARLLHVLLAGAAAERPLRSDPAVSPR